MSSKDFTKLPGLNNYDEDDVIIEIITKILEMIIKYFFPQRVPENSLNHHHHHHAHGMRRGRQKIPLFVESDKNVPNFVESEKGVPRFKENVNKANPFIRDTSDSEMEGKQMGHFSNKIPTQRSKLRDRGTKNKRKGDRDKKRPRSRNRLNSKAGKKHAKKFQGFRQEELKRHSSGGGQEAGGEVPAANFVTKKGNFVTKKGKFVTKKGKRRSKKQLTGPLSAGDLWSLNR